MAASPFFYGTTTLRFVALFLVLFGFVNKCYSHARQDTLLYETEEDTCATKDFILCRKCGADIVDAGYIVNNLSPKARSVTNQTVFHSSGVQVQRLVNPLGITFKTVALTRANCFGATEHWNLLYSWYPGYAWKACLCRRCGHQLGWMFEPISSATENRLAPSNDGFYLLILDSTLSEKFVQELASRESTMGDAGMTEEQKEFLAQCEEEFKDRYTDKDMEFTEFKNRTSRGPPIVDPWYNKPRRPNYDWSRQNRGRGERQNHHSDRRNNERNERFDRHAGRHHAYQRNSRPY